MTKLQKKLYKRKWYLKNKEKIYKYNKKYIKEHLKWYKKYIKKYMKNYKYDRSKYTKKYRQEHVLEIKLDKKIYRQKNKDKLALYMKNYRKSINHKIKNHLISRIWHVLKGINKSKSTMKLVGCSLDFLKQYLESQFKQGMNWNNYGLRGWHIDHIRPCASFDLRKVSEQKKCFHYTNLQPLWAEENWSKNCKVL
jgi:hypothetical protein